MNAPDDKEIIDIGLGIVLQGEHVLIAKRLTGAVMGGFWEFPGGKVREGESVEACVEREVAEEVGLRVHAEPTFMSVDHPYPHAHVQLHCCLCSIIAGMPRALECVEVRFVHRCALTTYEFPEANAPIIERVVALERTEEDPDS